MYINYYLYEKSRNSEYTKYLKIKCLENDAFPKIVLEKKKDAYFFFNKEYNSIIYVDNLYFIGHFVHIFSYNSSRIHLTLPDCLISY